MRITYLTSAAILIDTGRTKLLCDPWLVDGAYYGSWAHYPDCNVEPEDVDDVDYIYISHIHPDHFDPATLRRLDDDIPVLIHDYRWDYLQTAIADLGFEVIELPHDTRTHLDGDLHINILAADGCDPELCGNYFGCTWYDEADEPGSTQVDSMAVIDDHEHVVVDTNDCPFGIAEAGCRKIKRDYGHVDLLCHQYSAAQFYPQAVTNYDHQRKIAERDRVIREKHELALSFIDIFEPDYYMPFAGEYLLAGSLSDLNKYTANPPREEAREFFRSHVDPDDHECIFLNSGEHLDLERGERSAPFEPIDPDVVRRYIEEELSNRMLEYETDPMPTMAELRAYVPYAYDSLETKREKIGYSTETTVLITLLDDHVLELSMNGDGYRFVTDPDLSAYDGYVKMDVDPRLAKRLFEGPHSAYWADAKIGSHIGICKEPDIYERGLYTCLGSFHAHGHDISVDGEALDGESTDALA